MEGENKANTALRSPLLSETLAELRKPKRKPRTKPGRPRGALSAHPADRGINVASQIIVILRAMVLDMENGLTSAQRFDLAMELADYGRCFIKAAESQTYLGKHNAAVIAGITENPPADNTVSEKPIKESENPKLG